MRTINTIQMFESVVRGLGGEFRMNNDIRVRRGVFGFIVYGKDEEYFIVASFLTSLIKKGIIKRKK